MTEQLDHPTRLRFCVLALVLLNLVFVHITRAVEPHWLWPLYGLALASVVLARARHNPVYRAAWNCGVLAIFALLVHHASNEGIQFLLEDGLILAAFCQVHLLNNLGPRQKPDLLFFNSFLIALVTSFFCQDATFAVVFCVFAFVLTVGLQLSCAAGHPTRDAADTRSIALDGSFKAVTALAITMVVFLLWPRDFEREGLIAAHLSDPVGEIGFSDEVKLGRSGHVVATNRIAVRVRLVDGWPHAVDSYWRGATFLHFGGTRWRAGPELVGSLGNPKRRPDAPWRPVSTGRWFRPGFVTAARVEVTRKERGTGRLFSPLNSHGVELVGDAGNTVIGIAADGTVNTTHHYGFAAGPDDLRYELNLHAAQAEHGAAERHPRWAPVTPYLRIHRGTLPAAGQQLARQLADKAEGSPQHVVVEHIRHHLATHLDYLLPGAQGAARGLDEFLSGRAGGHCEYFATALALMLRSQGIPCRLVTGYLATEWNEEGTELTIRGRHAHAWVEVRDPAGFWYTVDASPASDSQDVTADSSWMDRTVAYMKGLWGQVAGFDEDGRSKALAWLSTAPGGALRWATGNPGQSSGLAAALLALAWGGGARRRERRRDGPRAPRGTRAGSPRHCSRWRGGGAGAAAPTASPTSRATSMPSRIVGSRPSPARRRGRPLDGRGAPASPTASWSS